MNANVGWAENVSRWPHRTRFSSSPHQAVRWFWAKLTKTDMPHEPHHPQRIFYYYCIHLRVVAQPAFVIDISEHFEKKMEVIRCYASQFLMGRTEQPPTFLDRLRDQAAYWGWAINTRFGEPFACREAVGLRGFEALV